MKTNNKTRANRWEREASRLLSLWVSGGKRKDLFWRTNSSGAKGTVTKEKNHCGDIVASDPAGVEFADRFHIEAKWRKEFDYADLGVIRKWIKVEGGKAKEFEKSLLMLIKGKGGEIYVLTNINRRGELRVCDIPVSDLEYFVFQGYAVSRVLKSPDSNL
ncbi:MAG: putative PDDEXK endonuclease [Thermodesulfovibrionales bacterium]